MIYDAILFDAVESRLRVEIAELREEVAALRRDLDQIRDVAEWIIGQPLPQLAASAAAATQTTH